MKKCLILKEWNSNFNKGVTIFQIFLMISMIIFGLYGMNKEVLFFSFICLFGYLEPNQDRFYIKFKANPKE